MRYSSVEILMGAVVLVTAIFFLILGRSTIDRIMPFGEYKKAMKKKPQAETSESRPDVNRTPKVKSDSG